MDAAGASALRSGALAEFALAVPLTTAILYANGKALWGGGRGVKGRQTLQGVLFQTTTLLAGLALIGAFATLTGPRIPSPTPPTLPSLGTGLLHLLVAAVALPLDARLAWACHAANAALRRSPHTTTAGAAAAAAASTPILPRWATRGFAVYLFGLTSLPFLLLAAPIQLALRQPHQAAPTQPLPLLLLSRLLPAPIPHLLLAWGALAVLTRTLLGLYLAYTFLHHTPSTSTTNNNTTPPLSPTRAFYAHGLARRAVVYTGVGTLLSLTVWAAAVAPAWSAQLGLVTTPLHLLLLLTALGCFHPYHYHGLSTSAAPAPDAAAAAANITLEHPPSRVALPLVGARGGAGGRGRRQGGGRPPRGGAGRTAPLTMSTTTTGGGHSHAKSHAAHPGGDAAVILWADAASPSLRYVTQDFDPTDTSSSMHVTSLESGAVRGAFSPLESGDGGPQQQHIAQGRGAWARLFSSRA